MRREGEDQRGRGRGREAHRGTALGVAVEAVLEPVGVVDQLHHGGDRGVELEAALEVPGHLVDRPVGLGQQLARLALRLGARLAGPGPLLDLVAEPPEAREEAVDALDALVGPVAAALGRAHEADVGAGVSAP